MRTHLPTDTPPRMGFQNTAGIITHGSLGEHFYALYSKVWPTLQSKVFPKVAPSDVAPNGLAPAWVVAINAYSPIAHRNPLVTAIPPRAGDSRGVAKPTQRPRNFAPGYVTRWPQTAPRWPSFAESPQYPGGGQQ